MTNREKLEEEIHEMSEQILSGSWTAGCPTR